MKSEKELDEAWKARRRSFGIGGAGNISTWAFLFLAVTSFDHVPSTAREHQRGNHIQASSAQSTTSSGQRWQHRFEREWPHQTI